MKSIRFLTALLLLSVVALSNNEIKAQSTQVNISVFQNELNPYGRWFNNPRFGQVWVYDDPAFRPYSTDGHWEYTNYGWSWVSDFDWGWAPFHYGRWEYDPFYGWMWIPGYEWASAWVSWSQYDGYYGWAPLGFGLGINVSFGAIPYDRWNFMPRQYMGSRDFHRFCSPPRNNYFRNAVTINNFYEGREGRFTRGPERREVERFTNNRIEERHIDYGRRTDYANNNGHNRRDNADNNRERNIENRNNHVDVYNNNNNRSNNNSSQGNVYENNRQPDRNNRNNMPQNNPINNNRFDHNAPNGTSQNFPGNRPNQPDNNNIPQQRNNRFERPEEQNRQQAPPARQETNRQERNEQYQQRNMQQREQQRMEQPRIERPQGGNNDRQMQQRNVPNNQPQRQFNHDGGRRQGRD
jgi:hypothetical protein